MKKLVSKSINASTSISELSAMELISILNQIPELKSCNIALEENPSGNLQIAVGDTVYDIL